MWLRVHSRCVGRDAPAELKQIFKLYLNGTAVGPPMAASARAETAATGDWSRFEHGCHHEASLALRLRFCRGEVGIISGWRSR